MENRFKLARTQHNQHGPQSVKEVASVTGITKSLIDDLESTLSNQRNVGYLTIKKLAEYYGVSSDYLLGLSPTPSVDEDIQVACKVTGLSEKAVQLLHSLDEGNLGVHAKGYNVPHLYVINEMLESRAVLNLFNSLTDFLIYGGVLPRDAYENDEPELTLDERERFYRWANRNGLEIEDRKNICEMHLQKACDELKDIFRDILTRETENNGQH